MLRDRWTTRGKIPCDLADGLMTSAQQTEDLPARRIGNRPKYHITLLASHGNHLVTDSVTR